MNSKAILAIVAAIVIALIAVWAIDIDLSGDVELPEVTGDLDLVGGEVPEVDVRGDFELPEDVDADVNVEGGEMPDVDVNTLDIDVEEETGSVELPTDVDVETEEKEFTYPTLDVEKPEENTTAEEDDL